MPNNAPVCESALRSAKPVTPATVCERLLAPGSLSAQRRKSPNLAVTSTGYLRSLIWTGSRGGADAGSLAVQLDFRARRAPGAGFEPLTDGRRV